MAKEKAVKVKETKTHIVLKVPAYSDNKLTGYVQVDTFQENEAGLAAAKQSLTLADVIDLNRQKVTDAKNNLRRGTSVMASLKALAKVNPAVEKLIALMVNQAQSGKFDAKTLELIEAQLKGAASK